MRKVRFGNQSRHPQTGKLGGRVFVDVDRGGWKGHYHFDTHGLSPEETAAKVAKIDARHDVWAQRQTGFGAVIGTEIRIASVVYRVMSCTIPPGRPYDDVEMLLSIREVLHGGELRRVDGWPIRLRFPSITAVPPNEAIIAEIRSRLMTADDRQKAHDNFTNRVDALLKVQ